MSEETPAREVMEFDVVVVGAGPAGLAAAIRLKQLEPERSVCVVEKGSEVGAHILSGAVMEPRALNELLPGWNPEEIPLATPARDDRFLLLTEKRAFRLPTPPQMRNEGNYVVSLGNVCRWLAQKAEALGVEIYPDLPRRIFWKKTAAWSAFSRAIWGCVRMARRARTISRAWRFAPLTRWLRKAAAGRWRSGSSGGSGWQRSPRRKPTLWALRNCGKFPAKNIRRVWSFTPSAGRWIGKPTAARLSIISAKGWYRSASWWGLITATRGFRRLRNCSDSRPIRPSGPCSRAAGASVTGRAPWWRAGCKPCRG